MAELGKTDRSFYLTTQRLPHIFSNQDKIAGSVSVLLWITLGWR